nr:retrovirus-related Pol polyprotein from transposon TNT 1-94 [Tanacetum cinerariifolium]
AISGPECDKWVVAMEEEVESLHKNETWELMKLPKEKRVIRCKWLFKVKDGIPEVESNQYKARYVVCGFDQRESEEDKEGMSRVPYSSVIGSLIWYSSLQAITALSTTEAEYISSTEGVKEAIWLRGMVNEFGLPQE